MINAAEILFITDLDGTLLPSSKEVTQEDLEAIRRFQQCGGKFAIATGRTLQAAMRYLTQLKPDVPVILFNGAAIYDTAAGKMLCTETLPAAARAITCQVLEAFPDVSAEILTARKTYVPRMTVYEEEHLQVCQVTPEQMPFEQIPPEGWLKVLFAMHPDRMSDIVAYFQQKQYDCADFVQSEARFYEMLPKGVTKGSALKKYRALGLAQGRRIVAAGDFDNDLEMLEEADISACPANAQPCVREMADIQLERTCDANAIEELLKTNAIYKK